MLRSREFATISRIDTGLPLVLNCDDVNPVTLPSPSPGFNCSILQSHRSALIGDRERVWARETEIFP
jgi:hypothetical protein